jgi:hypothetical protein
MQLQKVPIQARQMCPQGEQSKSSEDGSYEEGLQSKTTEDEKVDQIVRGLQGQVWPYMLFLPPRMSQAFQIQKMQQLFGKPQKMCGQKSGLHQKMETLRCKTHCVHPQKVGNQRADQEGHHYLPKQGSIEEEA